MTDAGEQTLKSVIYGADGQGCSKLASGDWRVLNHEVDSLSMFMPAPECQALSALSGSVNPDPTLMRIPSANQQDRVLPPWHLPCFSTVQGTMPQGHGGREGEQRLQGYPGWEFP
jgi:hypothetical protein